MRDEGIKTRLCTTGSPAFKQYKTTWVSENPSHEPSIPLCPQETKSSKNSNVIVITALQRDELWNTHTIEFDSSESECCVKVNAYEIFIYNTDVRGYLPVSEMGHVAMLHSN